MFWLRNKKVDFLVHALNQWTDLYNDKYIHRLQEQLRRIKRNEEKDKHAPPSSSKKKKKESAIVKVRVRLNSFFASGHLSQGIFCPSLGAEFRPHIQSKKSHLFSQYHVSFPN